MNLPPITAMSELDLYGKRVLIRADLNVPLGGGSVSSDTRIRASVPTILRAVEQGASVVVMSHLGRPCEGQFDPDASLAPVATRLAELLAMPVPLLAELEQAATVTVKAPPYHTSTDKVCREEPTRDRRRAPAARG